MKNKRVMKKCKVHGETEHLYESDKQIRCLKCRVMHVKNYRKRLKIKCVEYLGGKCKLCQYNKCITALEFHHLDPSEKELQISDNLNKSFESLKEELDKCVLLCANCHREAHAGE